ncbi:female-specific protein transformer [Scaptodrosophila lebanonensis]|uniref:Female-specific protein transformer n=1 Tax=Drosophila lebanonensis TaxID=7225 RepID=A0A6J2U9M1_DROLE|nr:female-specific protein transformer [Scaptodrosophila lebanonensis]
MDPYSSEYTARDTNYKSRRNSHRRNEASSSISYTRHRERQEKLPYFIDAKREHDRLRNLEKRTKRTSKSSPKREKDGTRSRSRSRERRTRRTSCDRRYQDRNSNHRVSTTTERRRRRSYSRDTSSRDRSPRRRTRSRSPAPRIITVPVPVPAADFPYGYHFNAMYAPVSFPIHHHPPWHQFRGRLPPPPSYFGAYRPPLMSHRHRSRPYNPRFSYRNNYRPPPPPN